MYKELAKSALAPKLKTYTLANAASVYGIPLNNHDAKSDAHATYEILKKLNYAMKVNGENYRKYIEPVNNLRKIIDLEVIV
jgi:DNA polymerase III epsilon subunit-like protein